MSQQNQGGEVRIPWAMKRLKMHLGDALCWTVFAPLVRAKRQHAEQRRLVEFNDKQRIDALLSDIVARHGDLLA